MFFDCGSLTDETSIECVRNILNKLISVHNIGGLLMSFDQRYWNKINQYNYIEHGIGLLDADGRLAQTSFTFVDDEGSRKKVEEDVLRLYPHWTRRTNRKSFNKLISVHNIGGLLMSFDQRYWNKINQYNYIEHGIGLLDADGRLAQTSFTFVDDEGSRKKVEEDVLRLYPQLDETSIEGVRNILNKLISVHNIGGLLMSFDQRYWNKINQYNYIEHGIGLLDADGRLAQTSFTFVDDEGSRKKVEEDVLRLYPQLAGLDTLLQEYPNLDQMEEYADRKQQLGKDLTQLRNAVRASYATGYLTDVFYRAVSKGKLQRNKRHRRKEKTVQFAGRIGYQT
ncbi:hypothetical protein Q3G72_029869 [Acer saccharum]|nr:hypothetical protein Q3G72_029869 [Acer saccharum]